MYQPHSQKGKIGGNCRGLDISNKHTTPINMNEEEEKKMLKMVKQMKAIPMPIYEGMALPTFPPIREKGVERVIDDIMNLQTRETDILICTLGKSGTHWTYEIIKMLLNNTTELDKSEKAHTMLEAILDLSIMDALPSPRVLNTHLKFKYIPKKFIEDKGKIVHMIRNPKDVCVSSYYHAMKDIFTLIEGTFGEFYDKWLSGEGFPYGSWFDYELAMEQAEKDHPGMIYTIQYEQMKKEPEKEIRKLAEFLGAKCSDQIITGIAKATLFENMKQNKADTSTKVTKDGSSYIYRKGQIGDWKNHFTVAQNEQFDAIFKEKMKNSSYDLVFE